MSQADLSSESLSPATTTPFAVGPTSNGEFVERRAARQPSQGREERRQFGSSHSGLTDDGRELALAIDQYKVNNQRRYLTCDEMLTVLQTLGYRKQVG